MIFTGWARISTRGWGKGGRGLCSSSQKEKNEHDNIFLIHSQLFCCRGIYYAKYYGLGGGGRNRNRNALPII